MSISREEMKTEALSRMENLDLNPQVIKLFSEKGEITKYLASTETNHIVSGEQLDRIRQFENDNNALVYYVIDQPVDMFDLEHYLYISNDQESWIYDNAELDAGEQLVYCYNRSCPFLSEYGYIGIGIYDSFCIMRVW